MVTDRLRALICRSPLAFMMTQFSAYDTPLLLPVKHNLIQNVRLIHAISECGFTIAVPPAMLTALAALADRFNCRFVNADSTRSQVLQNIRVDHSSPWTALGSVGRPLIFPSGLADYCYSLWNDSPTHEFSFCGHLTAPRVRCLTTWAARQMGSGPIARIRLTLECSIAMALEKIGLSSRPLECSMGPLTISSSPRGRLPQWKFFDPEYYTRLANSRYTLCPNGDFVWTYRFFEATLCGSIPVVESSCPPYEGFRYILMDGSIPSDAWRRESIEINRQRCRELLCVPRSELTEATLANIDIASGDPADA